MLKSLRWLEPWIHCCPPPQVVVPLAVDTAACYLLEWPEPDGAPDLLAQFRQARLLDVVEQVGPRAGRRGVLDLQAWSSSEQMTILLTDPQSNKRIPQTSIASAPNFFLGDRGSRNHCFRRIRELINNIFQAAADRCDAPHVLNSPHNQIKLGFLGRVAFGHSAHPVMAEK
jgi:hypothetical protein